MAKKKTTAKKKASARKTKAVAKTESSKKATSKKAAKKTAPKKSSRKTAPKTTPKKNATANAGDAAAPAKKKSAALGRPRIPVDAQLDVVFQKDFKAREAFSLLEISTVRELIRFGPDQLVQQLTSPTIQTVGRIRKVLAIYNRALSGDEDFAIEYQSKLREDGELS